MKLRFEHGVHGWDGDSGRRGRSARGRTTENYGAILCDRFFLLRWKERGKVDWSILIQPAPTEQAIVVGYSL